MANQYEGPVTPGPFLKLWGRDKYSDVTVRLMSDAAYGAQVVYEELAVHEVALVDGSDYLKGLFTTGVEFAAPSLKKQINGVPADEIAAEHSLRPICSLLCSRPEEAHAFKTVITFLYTHELPGSLTPATLHQIVTAADYLGAPECIKACIYNLASMDVEVKDIEQLHDLLQMMKRNLPSLCNLIKTAELKLKAALFKQYGEAREVITDSSKLNDLCQLPLSCVELLGASDQWLVDSENSVVVLLKHWWERQSSVTDEMSARLSRLVRLSSLSRSYLLAMDNLAWYVEPFPGARTLCLTMPTITSYTFENTPYNTLKLKPRLSYSQKAILKLGWQISVDTVMKMKDENKVLTGPRGYSNGYLWAAYLSWQSEQLLVSVEIEVHCCGIETAFCVANVNIRDNISEVTSCLPDIPFKLGGPGCKHVLKECSRSPTGWKLCREELVVKAEIVVTG